MALDKRDYKTEEVKKLVLDIGLTADAVASQCIEANEVEGENMQNVLETSLSPLLSKLDNAIKNSVNEAKDTTYQEIFSLLAEQNIFLADTPLAYVYLPRQEGITQKVSSFVIGNHTNLAFDFETAHHFIETVGSIELSLETSRKQLIDLGMKMITDPNTIPTDNEEYKSYPLKNYYTEFSQYQESLEQFDTFLDTIFSPKK